MSSLSTFITSLYETQPNKNENHWDHDNKKQWRPIGTKIKLSQLPCRRIYSNMGKNYDVALYCVHEKFYAINARCPHMGGPLDVIVDLEELMDMAVPHAMCPWHLYAYNLTNGNSPQGIQAETHEVKVENGYVFNGTRQWCQLMRCCLSRRGHL